MQPTRGQPGIRTVKRNQRHGRLTIKGWLQVAGEIDPNALFCVVLQGSRETVYPQSVKDLPGAPGG